MIPISGIISSSFYFLSGWSSELIDQVTRRLRSVTSKFPETLQNLTTGVEIKVSGINASIAERGTLPARRHDEEPGMVPEAAVASDPASMVTCLSPLTHEDFALRDTRDN